MGILSLLKLGVRTRGMNCKTNLSYFIPLKTHWLYFSALRLAPFFCWDISQICTIKRIVTSADDTYLGANVFDDANSASSNLFRLKNDFFKCRPLIIIQCDMTEDKLVQHQIGKNWHSCSRGWDGEILFFKIFRWKYFFWGVGRV